jgi:hypothetical protein
MYFILVVMGIEFAINVAHSETEYYEDWLQKNNGKSPIKRFTEKIFKQKHI